MSLRFGFELEGFHTTEEGLQLPPKGYPTDGFPGLCEVRTSGGQTLAKAYFELLNEYRKYPFNTEIVSSVFSPAQKRQIRARANIKDSIKISNIYGKEPRELGNRTIASLQINISKYGGKTPSYVSGSTWVEGRDLYEIFDYVPIIRALDQEFSGEIKAANRQPGFYSIKDDRRVEYRSLPNNVFETDIKQITILLDRIRKCLGE